MSCISIGSANADIAGLGVVLAFAIQGGTSLVLSGWSCFLLDVEAGGPMSTWANTHLQVLGFGKTRKEVSQTKRASIDRILAAAADTQVMTGIALLLSSLIQHKSLDLYHYHIVYDTINFTSVSFCAAILCCFIQKGEQRTSRFIAIGIFSILYLVFAIIFGIRLGAWNLATPGSCYNTRLIAASNAKHPYVDRIYLGITCFYSFAVLFGSVGVDEVISNNRATNKVQTQAQHCQAAPKSNVQNVVADATTVSNGLHVAQGSIPAYADNLPSPNIAVDDARLFPELIFGSSITQNKNTDRGTTTTKLADTSRELLTLALLQYPVHLYSVFALRASNEHLLMGESENTWGFGQIVALVMLAQTFIECFRGLKDYREKKRAIFRADGVISIASGLERNKPTGVAARAIARRETV